jgi:SAM-dependent methyltransferase
LGVSRPLYARRAAAAAAPEIELTIRVANADLVGVRAAASRQGLGERVRVVEPVEPTALVRALVGFDVGLVINRPLTRNDELVLPNKLFDYLMAGLAVVAPRLPGLAPLVEREQVGVLYEPGRPESLGRVLGELAADRDRVSALGRNARRLALDRYNAEAQAELVRSVLGRGGRGGRQEQVRSWWERNPMSYDVDEPLAAPAGSRAFFRELDARVFDERVLRLTRGPDGRPFSRFVDFDGLAGRDVLEVGCGSGFAAQLFAEAGAQVTAVDLTDWAVETTRARLAAFGLTGHVRKGDGEQLPFVDATFDLVFAWGVIHHTSDMERALGELVRVCRPGGRVVIMVYNRRSLFFAVYRLLAASLPLARRARFHFEGARAGETDGLIARHLTRSELRRLLWSRGLDVVCIQPYGQDAELLPLPRRLRRPVTDRLPTALKDWILERAGHQLAAVAKKPV